MTRIFRLQRGMELRFLLSCLVLGLLLQTSATHAQGMMLGAGSGGSGSGGGLDRPVIENCPTSLTIVVTVQTGPFEIMGDLNLTVNDNNSTNSNFSFVSSTDPMEQPSPISQTLLSEVEIDGSGASFNLTIDGDALNTESVTSVEFVISIEATDGFDTTEPCVLMVTVEFQEDGVCMSTDRRSDSAQSAGTSNGALQLNGVTVRLTVTQFGSMERLTFRVTIARFMNRMCALDCGSCGLVSNCEIIFRFCADFTSGNVILIEERIVESNRRKRQSTMSIEVVTAVTVPQDIPITSPLGIAVVPANLLVAAITDNQEEFENVTGFTINGTPTPLVPDFLPPILDFDNIVVIILSIAVALLVVALIVGIAVVLLVVFIIKNKKKQKVLPVNNDQNLRQSNVGKGHMHMETVE